MIEDGYYKYLLNQTYLYLLQHPEELTKIKYMPLGEKIGISRKTVAAQIAKLKEDGLLTELGLANIYGIKEDGFHPDKTERHMKALYILADLLNDELESCVEVCRLLDTRSPSLIYAYRIWAKDHPKKIVIAPVEPEVLTACVYAIVAQGKVIYIGYTGSFEQRRLTHLRHISGGCNSRCAYLYQYCRENNITDVQIVKVVESADLSMLRRLETNLIKLFRPEGNVK